MNAMTRATPHAAVHSLAASTGCRCPQCGGGHAAFDETDGFDEVDEVDEVSDEVFRALGGLARAAGGIGRAAGRIGGVARAAGQVGRAGRAAQAAARAGRAGGQLARAARAPATRQLARAARSQGGGQQPAPPPRAASRAPTVAQLQARLRQVASGTLPRRGRGHDPMRPMGTPAQPVPALNQALRQTLQSMGWTDWQSYGATPQAQPPNMQQLADLGAAGGVEPAPGNPGRLQLSAAGRSMIASGPFAGLAPLFSDHPGQSDIYRMQAQGQQLYIGRAGQNRPTGLRIMEHLVEPRGIGPRLRQMATDGRLGQITLDHGTIGVPDQGARSHLAEGALTQIHAPLWSDQRRHGFDDEHWI